MGSKRWIAPAVLAAVVAVPLVARLGVAPAGAAGAPAPASAAESCDQACTAIASCGRDAAALLGLAAPADPGGAPALDVPAARAACLRPCLETAREEPAFARTVASCSECVKTFDCRDVQACLATCRPDPAFHAVR